MALNNLPQCANKAAPLGLAISNFTVAKGVVARGLGLWVGSPLQIMAIRPSTVEDYIEVYNAADCVPGQELFCAGNWGGYYNNSQSRTYRASTKATWNGTGVVEETTQPADSYLYFNDDIQFGKNGSAPQFPLSTRKVGYNDGQILGIGPRSSFLDQAVANGAAPSRAYGLWTGSRSSLQPVDGSLIVGGYDSSRVSGSFTEFPMSDGCETCAIVSDISYQAPNGQSKSLFSNSSEVLSINLEPYIFGLQVPNDVWNNFVQLANSTGILRNINGNAGFTTDYSQLGNLSVTLRNGYKTVIPNYELFTYTTSVDKNSGVLGVANNTFLTTQLRNTNYTGYVYNWGMAFLSQNYMVVDFESNKFQLAPAVQGLNYQSSGILAKPLCSGVPTATITPVVTPSATNGTNPAASPAPSNSGTNVGAIAGGVVGGIVGLLIIGILAWWILRSKKREKALKAERDAAVATTGRNSQAGAHYGGETGMVQQQHASQFPPPSSPTMVSEVYGGEKAHDSPQRDNINQWLYSTQKTPTESSFNPGSDTQTHTSATVHGPVEMPAYQYR